MARSSSGWEPTGRKTSCREFEVEAVSSLEAAVEEEAQVRWIHLRRSLVLEEGGAVEASW
jgi:hypothetical protein